MDDDEPVRNGEFKIVALQHVEAAHRNAETAIMNRLLMIRAARSLGVSWDELGKAMGMSRQTAHKRFGSQVE